MKKLKWMILIMLALPLATNIKANNTVATEKTKNTVVVTTAAHESTTLIEQIFFMRGI